MTTDGAQRTTSSPTQERPPSRARQHPTEKGDQNWTIEQAQSCQSASEGGGATSVPDCHRAQEGPSVPAEPNQSVSGRARAARPEAKVSGRWVGSSPPIISAHSEFGASRCAREKGGEKTKMMV